MAELDDLYQEKILDHVNRPRNHREILHADRVVQGENRLCGDQVTVYLKTTGRKIDDLSFQGKGCALCMASSSMMTS